jgi:aminopeptidase N
MNTLNPLRLGAVIAALALSAMWPVALRASTSTIDVLSYRAVVRPDIPARHVSGQVTIRARVLVDGTAVVRLDRGQLTIEHVRDERHALAFDVPSQQLVVHLQRAVRAGTIVTLTVVYAGSPRTGLQFVPERRQAYTIFSTSQWLVCVDDPGDKATLDLEVQVPVDLQVIGSGTPTGQRPRPAGIVAHHFRLSRPTSSFLFGFAAGPFRTIEHRTSGTTIVFAGDGFTDDELRQVFRETPAMLRFFEERAGLSLPGDRYAQVLVANTAGQEAAGFAMLSEAYGRSILADASATTLLAHELAHQWWGHLVTCREWTHFWLNEGVATFMAAAWIGHRFGREAYEQEIARARARVEQVRQESGDRPLVFPSWERPTAADRVIVYQKGALALHALREEVGEDAFWTGMRAYLKAFQGQAVVSADFQAVMERAADRSLKAFFDEWVYGHP